MIFVLCIQVSDAGTQIRGSLREFRVYFGDCYDDGQSMSISDRHPNSKSLVLYPEAYCTQPWIQMNLMAVFNEHILQLLAMMVSQILSLPFAHSLGQKKSMRSLCNSLILCSKRLCKMFCRQWKCDSVCTCNCLNTSFCLDFSVFQVCF